MPADSEAAHTSVPAISQKQTSASSQKYCPSISEFYPDKSTNTATMSDSMPIPRRHHSGKSAAVAESSYSSSSSSSDSSPFGSSSVSTPPSSSKGKASVLSSPTTGE